MGLLDKHASRLPLFKHLNIGDEVADTGSQNTAGYGIYKKWIIRYHTIMKMKKWLGYHLVGTVLFAQRRLLPFVSIPSLPFREQMVGKGSSRPANPNPRQAGWQQAVSTPCSAHPGKDPPPPPPINTPDANICCKWMQGWGDIRHAGLPFGDRWHIKEVVKEV